MKINFETLEIAKKYGRPDLARIWGVNGHQAFSRGVFTPAGQSVIVLFVTHLKQECLTQYQDFIHGDLLFWEGEKGHVSDNRVALASERGEEIHLFYRERHHSPFIYHGKIVMVRCFQHYDRPSEFVFKIAALSPKDAEIANFQVAEERDADYSADCTVFSEAALNGIDRKIVEKSRGIAQRIFRGNLFKLWDGACAVSGVREPRILKSSHIKPWSKSSIPEKTDPFNGLLLIPNLDAVFNEGLVSFSDDGSIFISTKWGRTDQRRMHISDDIHLRAVFPGSLQYLEFHRKNIYLG